MTDKQYIDDSLLEVGKVIRSYRDKRKELKDSDYSETRLLNFYSGVGINFQNIASNDAVISGMINEIAEEGWELFNVISGVESDAGKEDGNGIFIVRYIFKRPK